MAEPRVLEANSRSLTARARMTAPTSRERTASARLSLASLDRPNDLLATGAANSFDPSVKAVLTRAGCLATSRLSAVTKQPGQATRSDVRINKHQQCRSRPTLKAIGVDVPLTMLTRADEVTE